ncbi:MAG: helix-turn-helix transcriptional regulator [Sphaerochaeta sp.]|uniref:helix-turn-helix transcriptional regulator n=1 Tax=Sphaerochaeta sp. PS TaxID=3076336 RepID=UPI0028A47DFC|nr:helix-turn-helix transcriptional regulator [Sphaerochaeta sp. PS]MDT4761044.1 helix-turn-helix transcriptional regulator [Sphaerochaeta sp. PS]MEA4863886.1 helix-turn-helix transcriptional regulator [Sphaerochaeta sp.]
MKVLSQEKLASLVKQKREGLGLTQDALGKQTSIHRQVIGRIESGSYLPSLPQLDALIATLNFSFDQLCVEEEPRGMENLYLRGNIDTAEAKEQFDTMFHMMMTLKRQVVLRDLNRKGIRG